MSVSFIKNEQYTIQIGATEENGYIVNTFVNLLRLPDDQPVRLVIFGNSKLYPWFIMKDVGMALGYTYDSYRNAFRNNVPDKEIMAIMIGDKKHNIVSLKGVLYLILRSPKSINSIFEKWVFDTVLPAINITNEYKAPDNGVYDFWN